MSSQSPVPEFSVPILISLNCLSEGVQTSPGGYGLTYRAAETVSTYIFADQMGIVIGSDDTAVTPTDTALGTQIRSGEKTGTILHCGTGVYGITSEATGDTGSFKVLGIFYNTSGASIDVKEVGIYAGGNCGNETHPNIYTYCILRDVITTISLADTEFLKVEYTISIAS